MKVEYGLILYLVVVNLIGFSLMGLDKWKAKHKKWRIAERTFFGIAIVGGSLGTWAGMYAFCHKTRHWYFVVGMPLILAIQAAVWLLTFGK
nr:DUF1294 domain-containing protein [Petralouisia muris]